MKTETETYNYSTVFPHTYHKSYSNPQAFRIQKVYKHEQQADNASDFFSYCLVDHTGKQFTCMHGHCHNYCNFFKTGTVGEHDDFHALLYHPDDRLLLYNEMLPDIQKFINLIPVGELPEYRFTFNHRYIHKDGNTSQFLHEGTLAFSADVNYPVLNLTVFSEIGEIKTDDTMVLTLFRYSAKAGYQKVFTKIYGEIRSGQLSQREREIIRLCLDGLSSKMIAEKLNLSIHTVKNHKRNCMEKTLTHNIAELINLCIRSRWL